MNPLVWYFASGRSFWAGLVMMGVASVLTVLLCGGVFKRIGALVYLVGLLFVFLSVTPLLRLLAVLIFLLTMGWLVVGAAGRLSLRYSWLLAGGTFLAVFAAGLFESPFHRTVSIRFVPPQAVFVIGDSVSSGLGGPGETAWPGRLGELLGTSVRNLAVAGATAETAVQRQLPKVTAPGSLVIVEIGGNDLLNNTPSDAYGAALGTLLKELAEQNHTVVMFELPRLVWHREHGRLQRRLAREYGVLLIPRTFLADLFGEHELTSDGIHLTQRGHDVFAERVYALFERHGDGY